jgi:hypothetical protein
MMIQPDDGNEGIAHRVTDQIGPQADQCGKIVTGGRLERQNHHRDDDGKNAVGKRIKARQPFFALGHDVTQRRVGVATAVSAADPASGCRRAL